MTKEEVAILLENPTITPEQLLHSKILPIGRNGIYDAIRRGEIEAIGIGKKKAILTAPLRRKLGLDTAAQIKS